MNYLADAYLSFCDAKKKRFDCQSRWNDRQISYFNLEVSDAQC